MSEVLNCDAAGCSHVEHVGKITVEMVGLACPACGSNLLTQADWIAWQPYSAILSEASSLPKSDDGPKVEFRVRLHGATTRIEFGPETKDDEPSE
jgi:hypothetical protein